MMRVRFMALLLAVCVSLPEISYADAALDIQADQAAEEVTILPPFDLPAQPLAAQATDPASDLWSRIRVGYAIPNLDNDLVNNQRDWYSARPDYILRTTQRASLYLYHVVEELEKRNMPTELALLPFIESAFNPQALSSAKASGMWQFMPATGRDFSLKQNMFQDERRSVLDSTDAALNYLEKLYGMFGDWQLALAAYNWGEGSVQRAIKKQEAAGLPIDYQSMAYLMPNETRNYVPKLQAVKEIIGQPELFNIELPPVDNEPYFVAIDKTRDIDVKLAAQLAELSVAEFKKLNPQFNRPVITGDADTKILLPADNLETFQQNLSEYEGPLSSWTAYRVPKNERVESIAKRVGASASIIREVNHIPANMLVKAGSTLLIPRSAHMQDMDIAQHVVDNASVMLTRANVGNGTKRILVTAKNKDSLAALARRYKVSVAQIKKWNNLKSNTVKAGQKLQIEVARAPVKAGKKPLAKSLANKSARPAVAVKRTKKTSVAQFKTGRKSF